MVIVCEALCDHHMNGMSTTLVKEELEVLQPV